MTLLLLHADGPQSALSGNVKWSLKVKISSHLLVSSAYKSTPKQTKICFTVAVDIVSSKDVFLLDGLLAISGTFVLWWIVQTGIELFQFQLKPCCNIFICTYINVCVGGRAILAVWPSCDQGIQRGGLGVFLQTLPLIVLIHSPYHVWLWDEVWCIWCPYGKYLSARGLLRTVSQIQPRLWCRSVVRQRILYMFSGTEFPLYCGLPVLFWLHEVKELEKIFL